MMRVNINIERKRDCKSTFTLSCVNFILKKMFKLPSVDTLCKFLICTAAYFTGHAFVHSLRLVIQFQKRLRGVCKTLFFT